MSTFDISPHVLRPQQERSRAALAKIVQAAEKILRKDGIDGFSMAAVAESADLPVGNIYRRFKGKDELLQAIKHDVTSRIEMAVAARLSQQQFSISLLSFEHLSGPQAKPSPAMKLSTGSWFGQPHPKSRLESNWV